MAEGQLLFTLDFDRYNSIRGGNNLLELQEEFNTKNTPLSQSLLISQETKNTYWLLVDFENGKTYDIRKETGTTVEISEGADIERHTDLLSDAGTIVPRLQDGVGTHKGIIDALQRLNFDRLNIENLERSDLSVRKLSFESVYPDLEIAYGMLQEILAAPRIALISLSFQDVEQLKYYVLQSYEITSKIVDFGIGNREENIRDQHVNLSQEIHQFCDGLKQSLFQISAYLSSRRVDRLVAQVNTTLTDAEEKLNTTINTQTERLQNLGEETQQKEKERQESFDQLYVQLQNQLTEKPISQYKAIFQTQAKKHGKIAWVWLGITVGLTLVSGGIFWWVLKDLLPANNNISAILPNLLAKGFFLSLIYLLLNRSMKNYTAEKHLEVTNTHRQNALETVDTFFAAAGTNQETRDTVLVAATKAIYDANQSGYLSTKTSGSDNASPIQQIIKEITPDKSSTGGN